MPLISALLSLVAKKIGTVIQAIFGWSVTALFGKLPPRKQLIVTIALVLSITWPIFVVGLFFPAVAGWVLAFAPLEKWVSPLVLRIVWATFAVLSPPIVGLLVRWAAPAAKGSALRSAIHGYPLALGFFASFIITAVSVPIVKLVSLFRGWSDTHVYVQPLPGRYDGVVRELAEACARAGLLPEVSPPPTRMMLATNALRVLAKGAVSPIVAEELRMVRADGLELVLYPSDLLLRGEPKRVARVRAMMTRTDIDGDAYLVGSPRGQEIQDELGRLVRVVRDHEHAGETVGRIAERRLAEIWRSMNEAELPFDEWVMLEGIARRVERRIVSEHTGGEPTPLDRVEDGLAKISEEANATPAPGARGERPEGLSLATHPMETTMSNMHPPPERVALGEASTTDLVREALDEAKELVKIEVEIAKNEVKKEISETKTAAVSFGVALAATFVVLSLLAVALVLALGGSAVAALGVAGAFLVVAGAAAYLGYAKLPKKPLAQTRHNLRHDMNQLKEHIA